MYRRFTFSLMYRTVSGDAYKGTTVLRTLRSNNIIYFDASRGALSSTLASNPTANTACARILDPANQQPRWIGWMCTMHTECTPVSPDLPRMHQGNQNRRGPMLDGCFCCQRLGKPWQGIESRCQPGSKCLLSAELPPAFRSLSHATRCTRAVGDNHTVWMLISTCQHALCLHLPAARHP